jgi:hypothetical protein
MAAIQIYERQIEDVKETAALYDLQAMEQRLYLFTTDEWLRWNLRHSELYIWEKEPKQPTSIGCKTWLVYFNFHLYSPIDNVWCYMGPVTII